MHPRNPFEAPSASSVEAPPPSSGGRPQVVFWYKVMCGLTALLYVAVAIMGAFMLAAPADAFQGSELEDPTLLLVYGVFCTGLGVGLTGAYVAPFFLRPSKGAWILGIALIGLTLTSCCYWPFCIPLLIFWLKDENKAYFGA